MTGDPSTANVGAVVSVRGSVVDVRFDGRLPSIYSVLRAEESLANEGASRLSAMQTTDKNINDLLEELNGSFHLTRVYIALLRQSTIDEELFDMISGVEALWKGSVPTTTRTDGAS